jgi:predicted ester cyclase
MPNQDIDRLLQRLFARIDAEQSMASLGRFTTQAYVAHFPGHAERLDLEAMTRLGAAFYHAFPGMRHELAECISDGNRSANRLTVHGAHMGPFPGPTGVIAPTGRQVTIPVLNLFRFEDGLVAEQWAAFDLLGIYQQLGILIPEKELAAPG